MSAELPALIAEAKAAVKWRVPGKVAISGTPLNLRVFALCEVVGDCWEYQGRLCGGYGRIGTKRFGQPWAHRIAYEAANGPITDPDLCVCHRCDNPVCCNPDHLFTGTRGDNNRDRHAKGRTVLPDPGVARGRYQRETTHCPQGHPYDDENTYVTPKGDRRCRACAHTHSVKRAAARKAARQAAKRLRAA